MPLDTGASPNGFFVGKNDDNSAKGNHIGVK